MRRWVWSAVCSLCGIYERSTSLGFHLLSCNEYIQIYGSIDYVHANRATARRDRGMSMDREQPQEVAHPADDGGLSPSLSIIIPTLNEEKLIERTLLAVKERA